MSEAFQEHPDYFTENAELLDTINNQILDIISGHPNAAIAFDLTQDTNDTILNHEALSIHHARRAVERLRILASEFQLPAGSIFAWSQPEGLRDMILELTILTNTNEEPFALRSVSTRSKDALLDITTITHINGVCTESTHYVIPKDTQLTDAIKTYIFDTTTQAELLSLIRYHTESDDIDALLTEVLGGGWFTALTTIEGDIAEQIKAHITQERESRLFAAQLHIDKPNIDDLRELLSRLA